MRSTHGSRSSGSTYPAWVAPPRPKVPYNFAMLACFVGRLVDELGYDQFDVLGISWGGGLAQQLAFQYPRRCRDGAGQHRDRHADGAGQPSACSQDAHPAELPRPDYARSIAAQCTAAGCDPARRGEARAVRAGAPRAKGGYFLQLLAGVGWTSLPPCRSSGSRP